MARMDSSIIGQDIVADVPGAIARGVEQRANMLASRNKEEYDAAVKQYGAAAIAGDKKARNFLAQWDPAGMRALDDTDAQRAADAANTAADNARADEELRWKMKKEYDDQLAKLSETDRAAQKAEVERIATGALGINDEATWNAYVTQNGGSPEEYPFSMKDTLIYSVLPPSVVQDYVDSKKTGADPYGQGVPAVTTEIIPATTTETGTPGGLPLAGPFGGTGGVPAMGGAPVVETPAMGGAPAAATEAPTVPNVFVPKSRTGVEAESGYGWALVDGQEVQVPLPGAPTDNASALKGSIASNADSIRVIDELLALPEGKLNNSLGFGWTQAIGDTLDLMGEGWFPGSTEQSIAAKNIDTLGAALSAIGMESLKAAGQKGVITDEDARAEGARIVNLDRNQTEEGFRQELEKLKARLAPAIEGQKRQLYVIEKSRGLEPSTIVSPNAKPAAPQTKQERMEELRRKKAGN